MILDDISDIQMHETQINTKTAEIVNYYIYPLPLCLVTKWRSTKSRKNIVKLFENDQSTICEIDDIVDCVRLCIVM